MNVWMNECVVRKKKKSNKKVAYATKPYNKYSRLNRLKARRL
jgi:hypothetical protein